LPVKKIIRLFHTLKFLRFRQLLFFIIRRCLPARAVAYTGTPVLRDAVEMASPLTVGQVWEGKDRFSFLNKSRSLGETQFNWCPEDVPRLWRYNLHYFDCLRQANKSAEEKQQLITDWISNNPQGSQPGWEPFTASLRIVNWIFFLYQNPQARSAELLQSLYTQVLWLEKNDERHILANHYFENLKALVFAGVFFQGDDAERWLARGIREVAKQLAEQTLPDGGHYERTPQYHGLMLENYLDLYNLSNANAGLFPAEFTALLKQHCEKGLAFYQAILFPDNRLPLFNDTAFCVSPTLEELHEYYWRLTGQSCLPGSAERLVNLPDSGVFGYRHNKDMFVMDAGDIGPAYQPGHTHCDMLSYELMLDGQRIVVDTGVYEYSPGEMRHYIRSTRAHNTVSVDGDEQSEIWGEFRVARRAKKLGATIRQGSSSIEFEGSYKGFYAVKGGAVHNRQATISLDEQQGIECIDIADTVNARGEYSIESFIHLHPDLAINKTENGKLRLELNGRVVAELIIDAGLSYSLEDAWYFGKKIRNKRVTISRSGASPLVINYQIRKL
jgi:uncharacterized heparinase superfamily protein